MRQAAGAPEAGPAFIEGLIRLAADFYQRGWMWGTSGNLSVKLAENPLAIAVTASGASKGQLTLADIAVVPAEARSGLSWLPPPAGRPSAETAIHLSVYRRVPEAGAVLHVHTVASTALSLLHSARGAEPAYIPVTDLEMLKGWGVEWGSAGLRARIPVLPNQAGMEGLAAGFDRLLEAGAGAPVVLVRGHGMTVWGATLEEARHRLEIAEFICQVLLQLRAA